MRLISLVVGIVVFSSLLGFASEADLHYVDSILDLTGLFIPQGIKLAPPPASVTIPSGVDGDLGYGVIPLNGQGFPVLIERDKAALYVKSDSKAAFEPVPWSNTFASGEYVARFSVKVSYTSGVEPYELLAIWDPGYPSVLVYFRGGYREGTISLGDAEYRIGVVDENTSGRYDDLDKGTLFIDTDQDGKLLTTRDSHERFSLSEPFNIKGEVYVVKSISADGAHIVIGKSDTFVPEKAPLEVGYPAPDFSGTTSDGKEITLSGLKGKIVVLDFWAGWCTPCVTELPNVKALSSEYKGQGVVVLGINLDRTKGAFQQAVEDNGLNYPQVYDGPDGPIAALYRITAIPMSYLIDQNGKIAGKNLRGESLQKAVEKLISPKG